MAVILNQRGYAHAQQLIDEGKVVLDGRDEWSEHQPSTQAQNEFIREHGFSEYSKWFLGLDDQEDEGKKSRYKFPYGDFKDVHRCAILSAESRAAQFKHTDVEVAVAHLHGMLDKLLRAREGAR